MSSPHGEVLRLIDDLKRHVIASGGRITPKIDEATDEIATITRAFMLPQVPETEWEYLGLPHAERKILAILAAKFGRVVTQESLLDGMYFARPDDPPAMKIIDVYVCKIRRKFIELDSPLWIETLWGVGYRLVKDEQRTRTRWRLGPPRGFKDLKAKAA